MSAQEKVMELIVLAPELDLEGRMGGTSYIDFLQKEDLAYPVMIGQDKYERPFIAMRLRRDGEVGVVTVFKRFTDPKHPVWVAGNSRRFPKFIYSAMTEENWEQVRALIEGETIYEKSTFHDYPDIKWELDI